VNIVPRVTGYLTKMPFKEGSLVKKGDLLFEVDTRPYKAQLDQADGQVKLYEAQLKLAKVTLERDLEIAKTPGAISLQQLDTDRASVAQAEAAVKAAQASLEVSKLNLAFCSVTAPVDGMVARYYLTLGNLVNQDQTLLTTVVSLDPMYAYAPEQYVVIDQAELEPLRPPQERALCLERFLEPQELDPALFSGRTLYLAPDGLAARHAYDVLTQALSARGKWALGRVVLGGRSRPVVPCPHRGLWLEPELLCQVNYLEWTRAGRLRGASFHGMLEAP
jgi:multidrug efflux pump subunit AcrA (membrane-fusion protein)